MTKKLWRAGHPISETLPKRLVVEMVDALFPMDLEELMRTGGYSGVVMWLSDYEVTVGEIREAMKKFRGNKKAPCPDGVWGGMLSHSRLSYRVLGEVPKHMFAGGCVPGFLENREVGSP